MSKAAYHLILTGGAREDMHTCRKLDPYAAAIIGQILREVENDPSWCDLLVDERYSDDDIGSVEPLWDLQDGGVNAYRIKFVVIDRWRLITAADRQRKQVAIMAVMNRKQDYQNDPVLWKRIKKEYDDLSFPLLGR